VRHWSEHTDGAADTGSEQIQPLLDGLRGRGIQLVVKPHPMDADRRHWDGTVRVSESDLVRSGVTLYGLLGQSRGLVTDYSSVWVDYLLLDRPMAFLVPDRDSYSRTLVPSDVLDWLPGELVDPAEAAFREFLADLDSFGGRGAVLRKEVANRIGLNRTRTAADDLVTALVELDVLAADS
jgi:CDP-glycerol glycerophosphotransferase (TagB/SpsB family)